MEQVLKPVKAKAGDKVAITDNVAAGEHEAICTTAVPLPDNAAAGAS